MNKIKTRIAQLGIFNHIQLKLLPVNENEKPTKNSWNEGINLKSEDTILSCQLYEDNNIILAKIDENKVNCNLRFFLISPDYYFLKASFHIFVKTFTKTTFLWSCSSMTVLNVKQLIQDKDGVSVDIQRLIYNGQQLDDDRYLSDYNIRTESIIHLIERCRGGMYHFTSGRQDFHCLTYNGAKAVKNVLKFKIKSTTHARHSSLSKLQEYILKSQNVLSNLYSAIKDTRLPEDCPDLKTTILPISNDENSSDSEDESSDE
jgi:hypothetical protein